MSEVLSIKEADEVDRFWGRFRSTPKKLARWLFESREKWKSKYQALKVQLKRFQVQLSDVRKSREQWKERAQYSAKELEQMKAEVERLRQQVQQAVEADLKKI
jgi:phage shock protein A